MSSSANIFRTADAAFHHAIELFFGMNPSSPWWVLVVFYLARHRKLRVVENASPSRYTLAHMDYSYGEISFSPQIISGWKERGIHDLCLEADIDTDSVEAEFIFNVVNWRNGRVVDYRAEGHFPISASSSFLGRLKMEPMYLFEVAESFMSISDEWYEQNFVDRFDEIIKTISDLNDKAFEVSYQPEEITELVSRLIDREGCSSIYNPFAGVASYGVKAAGKRYLGQELNPFAALIGKLRLKAYGMNEDSLVCKDSILDWDSHGAECIVATPPFGLRLGGQYDERGNACSFSIADTAESFCIEAAMNSTAKLAVFVVGPSFCNRNSGSDFAIRKTICEGNSPLKLKYVIELPENLFATTEKGSYVIVLDSCSFAANPLFVDATLCFTKIHNRSELDVDRVFQLIDDRPRYCVASVNYDALSRTNYMFSAKYYIAEKVSPKDGERVVRLDSIIVPKRVKLSPGAEGVVVESSLFSSDWYDCMVNKNQASMCKLEKMAYGVAGPHIIVSYFGDSLKAYIHDTEDLVILNSNQCALEVIDSEISLDYAALLLLKEKSVQRFPQGSFGQEFRNMQILCSTLYVAICSEPADRESLMKSIKEETYRLRNDEKEAIAKRLGISQLSSDISHMLGTTMSNSNDIIDDIRDMDVSDEGYKEKVDALIDCINKTFRVIKTCGANLADNEFNKKEICIGDYLAEYARAWRNYGTKKFVLNIDMDVDKTATVYADKTMLDIQLDTILDNARKHGFGNNYNENNQVRIYVSGVIYKTRTYILLRVSNNGKPLRGDMSMEDFISPRRYRIDSGRLSQGGYHIYTIAKKNDGFFYLGKDQKNQMYIDILIPATLSLNKAIYEYDRECI